jgi:hypothetical protein
MEKIRTPAKREYDQLWTVNKKCACKLEELKWERTALVTNSCIFSRSYYPEHEIPLRTRQKLDTHHLFHPFYSSHGTRPAFCTSEGSYKEPWNVNSQQFKLHLYNTVS